MRWKAGQPVDSLSNRPIARRPRGLGRGLVVAFACALCLLRPIGVGANSPSSTFSGDWEEAQRNFRLAIAEFDKEECEEAQKLFQRALDSWPPDADRIVRLGPLAEYYYVPLFHIGRCYAELENAKPEDYFRAVRFFGLAKCRAEITKTPDSGGLEEKLRECVENARSPVLPKQHKEFQEGYRAYEKKKWKYAALRMWEALQVWEETNPPDRARVYGKYPEPYIPRFYLGRSLLELKCYREALSQFEQTVVGRVSEGTLKEETRELAEWTIQAKKRVDGQEESEICWQWACWLGSCE